MKIGIVTVSFNQARFLQEAIDSVRITAPHEVEYVLVDPGSSDDSRAIAERNRARFAKIILEKDRGPADGLNKGFAACDADVLGYINSDDRFAPGALDFVAEYFTRHPDVDLLLGAIRIVDVAGRVRLRGRAPDRMNVPKFVSGACFAWQQATFFRRELFARTGFNVANRACWDGELVLDMVLAGARIGYSDTILGDFRIHKNSLTGSGRQAVLEKAEIVRWRVKAAAAGRVLLSPLRARLARFRYKCSFQRHWRCLFGIRLPSRNWLSRHVH
ncbi:MAG TPA: glycosyltransferase [Bryobacteraceae bacterium]|jgi:glycosyltransferase involved in cell wall biosynthesis|nr:glycosyltransferase [Bryobacteraceae bacterium]